MTSDEPPALASQAVVERLLDAVVNADQIIATATAMKARLLDSGRPQGIFWSAVLFMLFTVVISLLQERRTARGRVVAEQAAVAR